MKHGMAVKKAMAKPKMCKGSSGKMHSVAKMYKKGY